MKRKFIYLDFPPLSPYVPCPTPHDYNLKDMHACLLHTPLNPTFVFTGGIRLGSEYLIPETLRPRVSDMTGLMAN